MRIIYIIIDYVEANFDMPCEAEGIGTLVPGLFKAKAGKLLLNWG